jgi:hypothetical protein
MNLRNFFPKKIAIYGYHPLIHSLLKGIVIPLHTIASVVLKNGAVLR